MTKLAYLQCPTGIAGDMCLGALVHAGVPLDYLIEQLDGLGLSQEYKLRAELVQRNQQQGTKVYVDLQTGHHYASETGKTLDPHHSPHHHHHPPVRHLPEIEQLIVAAKLPQRVQDWSLAVFRTLAQAEAAVHGIPPERVHFHEVGATDAMVDIVGTCLGLDWLDVDGLYCSPLPTGGGTVRAAHGLLPVPAPAVLKLWEFRQVPIYSNGIDLELVTPTGAAIAVTLAKGFGAPPPMRLQKVGLGAGSRDLPLPNLLRLWIGEELGRGDSYQLSVIRDRGIEKGETSSLASPPSSLETITISKQGLEKGETSSLASPPSSLETITVREQGLEKGEASSLASPPSSLETVTISEQGLEKGETSSLASPPSALETVAVLETQIDDLSPQAIGYVFEALFEVGALDVFTQPIGMKKCRPGILLSAICPLDKLEVCEGVIFRETTTLGIRRSTQQRAILPRQMHSIATPYGEVRVKVATDGNGKIANVQPEYEDCARLARENQLSWREVHRIALQAWYRQAQNSDMIETRF